MEDRRSAATVAPVIHRPPHPPSSRKKELLQAIQISEDLDRSKNTDEVSLQSSDLLKVRNCEGGELGNCSIQKEKRSEELNVDSILIINHNALPVNEKMLVDIGENPNVANSWTKKPYIRLNFKKADAILIDDGKEVKLLEENEMINDNRLGNSLVAKVFGREIPPHVVAWVLRLPWAQLGQFHFTTLGLGWFLCSFKNYVALDRVLSGGPWFMNGHIIGMERWSIEFSPSSMKELTSNID
ncbi:hypothetical protein MA16_Dca015753 [Dendrobium catenatum]|uniref:DUF4283 domain-containing protein n=1 Tax=Dendrobium catenatum TaxID=906689 RepID=A0A2I0WHV5_9ASPA|nr:hypothetical protein MA16_Dca015753 [Dendrobium catenatum]